MIVKEINYFYFNRCSLSTGYIEFLNYSLNQFLVSKGHKYLYDDIIDLLVSYEQMVIRQIKNTCQCDLCKNAIIEVPKILRKYMELNFEYKNI